MSFENVINVIILLALINFCNPLIPTWKLDENGIPFFPSNSQNYKEIVACNDGNYKLTNIYTKNNDGTISVQHKLDITKNSYTNSKNVDFGNMKVFRYVQTYGEIICPEGKYLPLDSDGNQIPISITSPNLDYHLKCVGHGTGVFLAFFLNKDSHSLYGYLSVKDGGKWDGGNEFHHVLYDLKTRNTRIYNDEYPIIFLALAGPYIKLVGAKQTLEKNLDVHRDDIEVKTILKAKDYTYAYFNENDDKFFLITYDKSKYSIVYSLKEYIEHYENNDDIKNVGEIPKEDLTLDFADKIEIVKMNFINKTPYIYYTVKNLETGKNNYGIMDFLSQKVLFNTDQEITKFEPLSNYEMLVFYPGGAYKICLFRNGDSCESSCPSGTTLVLDVNGNKCKSTSEPDTCALKLVPDNICIDTCDTNIYKLSADGKSCGLCGYFDNTKPYRIIKTDECLESIPEGAQIYNEKYNLLECAKGYQLDSVKKKCVPHCYPSCLKCNDYSENSKNHDCIECKEGYYLNGTNCDLILTDAPTTFPAPTTPITPTTSPAPTTPITPTTSPAPTTPITPTTSPAPTTPIVSTTSPAPTTPITPTTSPAPTTPIIPTTQPEQPSPITPTTPPEQPTPITPTNPPEQPSPITPTSKPSPGQISLSTSSPTNLLPEITQTETLQSTILEDKCLNGTELKDSCKNLTDNKINFKIKEEVLSSYAQHAEMKVYKTEKYSVQVSDTRTELGGLNLFNNIPVIDLGDCEKKLREANNIPQDKALIIIKLDKKEGSDENSAKSKYLEVDVYDPITFQKLNLSVCDNTTVDLYVPLEMSEKQEEIYTNLIDEGYEPLNLRDKFYRELCTPYTSENGTDVLLDEREEFVYSTMANESTCYGNCEYVSYSLDTKYMKCECPVNDTYTTLDVKHISGNNIYMSFMSVFKSTNYKVMICYNLVFNFKIFCHNYGSILSLICFIVYLIFMVVYCSKQISPLKVHISKLIFIETEKAEELNTRIVSDIKKEKTMTFKEKSKLKPTKRKSIKNPPKHTKTRKIENESDENNKNTEEIEFVNIPNPKRTKKRKSTRGTRHRSTKLSTNIVDEVSQNDLENKNNKKKNNGIVINSKAANNETKEVKRKYEDLDMYELNNLDYDEACEIDNRGFCKTYWSVLMREHIVLFTFFACYDYNLFYIKIERFFLLICTQMTINGLFFIHESMHRKYTNGDDLTFIEKIPQLLFTLIGGHIIEVILCFFSMTDVNVYEIKSLPKEEKNGEKVINIIDKMKRKLAWFFAVTFILFLFYWYFISAFCAVYQNTQTIFLRDSGISILTSFIDPFIIYGITTLLRLISLSLCCKKKLGCIYKLSDIIPIF